MAPKPDWYEEALRSMKETDREGIVLVVPTDQNYIKKFSDVALEIWRRFARQINFRARLILMKKEIADRLLPGDGNMILLDPEGNRVDSTKLELKPFTGPGEFYKAMKKLLRSQKVKPADQPELPFGVKLSTATHKELFGSTYDPCPPCGMPHHADDESFEILKFLD